MFTNFLWNYFVLSTVFKRYLWWMGTFSSTECWKSTDEISIDIASKWSTSIVEFSGILPSVLLNESSLLLVSKQTLLKINWNDCFHLSLFQIKLVKSIDRRYQHLAVCSIYLFYETEFFSMTNDNQLREREWKHL